LLDDVVDAGEHAVRGELTLPEANQRLHLADETRGRGERRMLATEVSRLPAQHVAEEHRRFVVEVVSRREDVVSVRHRRFVEDVALRESARGTGDAPGGPRASWDIEAVRVLQVDLEERPVVLLRERPRELPRAIGVAPDAETDIEAVGFVAQLPQQLPQ